MSKKENKVDVGGLVAGMVAPTAIGVGAVGLMGGLGEKGGKHSFDEIQRAATGMVRDDLSHTNTDKLTFKGMISGQQAPHYMPGKTFGRSDYIISPTSNTAVTAHEIGHSSSKFINSKGGNILYGISTKASPILGIAGAIKGSKGEELSSKEKAISLSIAAPMLYEETRANLVGIKASFKLGGKRGLLKALPSLAGSQASYLGVGLSPIISNYIARKAGGEKLKKSKSKENTV